MLPKPVVIPNDHAERLVDYAAAQAGYAWENVMGTDSYKLANQEARPFMELVDYLNIGSHHILPNPSLLRTATDLVERYIEGGKADPDTWDAFQEMKAILDNYNESEFPLALTEEEAEIIGRRILWQAEGMLEDNCFVGSMEDVAELTELSSELAPLVKLAAEVEAGRVADSRQLYEYVRAAMEEAFDSLGRAHINLDIVRRTGKGHHGPGEDGDESGQKCSEDAYGREIDYCTREGAIALPLFEAIREGKEGTT